MQETESRRRTFYELKTREENSMVVIANQTKKIHTLQVSKIIPVIVYMLQNAEYAEKGGGVGRI